MAQALIQYFILEGMHILYRGRVSVTSVVLWSEVNDVSATHVMPLLFHLWWDSLDFREEVKEKKSFISPDFFFFF